MRKEENKYLKLLVSRSNHRSAQTTTVVQSQDVSMLPSLFQRTETSPLLGFGVEAFHRVKQLPIGAPT